MTVRRRTFLATTATLMAAAARPAFALRPSAFGNAAADGAPGQWQESQRYPDPRIEILDPSFAEYRINSAKVERAQPPLHDGEHFGVLAVRQHSGARYTVAMPPWPISALMR